MRIIIKPLGVTVMALALGGAFFTLARGIGGAGTTGLSFPWFGGAPANMAANDKWKIYTEKGAAGFMDKINPAPGGKPLEGYHISVENVTTQPWNVGVNNALGTGFGPNERLTLHFWARADRDTKLDVMMQKNTPGFPDCFRRVYDIGPDWKEYDGSFTTITMAPYESMLAFHCGYQKGWVEIAGVELKR